MARTGDIARYRHLRNLAGEATTMADSSYCITERTQPGGTPRCFMTSYLLGRLDTALRGEVKTEARLRGSAHLTFLQELYQQPEAESGETESIVSGDESSERSTQVSSNLTVRMRWKMLGESAMDCGNELIDRLISSSKAALHNELSAVSKSSVVASHLDHVLGLVRMRYGADSKEYKRLNRLSLGLPTTGLLGEGRAQTLRVWAAA